ncbi:MAG: hypothetical protein KIS92_00060 [Planctomycetota bacterium]|nr:hypothetical protein [Planctomycetota bacterium]
MASRTFHIIAHRGDSANAPENTLCAFDAAIKRGADEIETDVRVTKDGVAVLLHDANLFRTTGKEAEVKDLTFEEVRQLDAANFSTEKFKNTRVPALDEALTKYLPKIPFEIELKAFGAVVPTIQALQKQADQGAFERVLLTSFNRQLLVSALMLDGRCRVGLLLEPHSTITVAEIKHMGGAAALPHWEDVTKDMVDEAHRLNMAVRVWGVNSLETAKKAIDAGADGATYNDSAELAGYLKEAGLRNHEAPLPPMAVLYATKALSKVGEKEREKEEVPNGKHANGNGKAALVGAKASGRL